MIDLSVVMAVALVATALLLGGRALGHHLIQRAHMDATMRKYQ